MVQLHYGKGTPTRAQQDLTVRLSSSLTNVGTVDSTITIPEGAAQTSATFYTTYTAGTTTITAAASGYSTVQTTVTTVGPLPTVLAVYAFPPVLPSDGETYSAIIVQLQDSSGSPAKAPIEGTQITLTTSNATVGTIQSTLTINAGETFATANIQTNATGTATITATASGYSSGKATVTTQQAGDAAVNLKIYLGPPRFPQTETVYQPIGLSFRRQRKISQPHNRPPPYASLIENRSGNNTHNRDD
jgi:hypothetical protein